MQFQYPEWDYVFPNIAKKMLQTIITCFEGWHKQPFYPEFSNHMWHLSVDIIKTCFWSQAKFYMNQAWHTQNKNIFMTLIWLPNWSMTFTPCMLCHVFCGRMTPGTAFRVLLYLEGDLVSSDDPSQYKNNLFEMNCHHSEPWPSMCLSSVLYNRGFLICAMTEHSCGSLISWTLRIESFF